MRMVGLAAVLVVLVVLFHPSVFALGNGPPPVQAGAEDSPSSPMVWRFSPALETDLASRLVRIEAMVVFREGPMELFLCPLRTKEHESILAAELPPKAFQTALLLAGAMPGRPVRFEPFEPPRGHPIKVWVEWEDGDQTRRADGRQWVRSMADGGPLLAQFVFTGSQLLRVPGMERPVFRGDDGDLICVANFPGSIIDIAAASSADNPNLLYEPWTERIPPLRHPVRLILEPLVE